MAMPRLKYLSEAEVRGIADRILLDAFAAYGYSGLHVEESEDFDGSWIFRVTATVEGIVSAADLIKANDRILLALRQEGDDRFVILATKQQGVEDEPDEDID